MRHAPMIPALRKAGYTVDKGHRPNSRGMRYIVIRNSDQTSMGICYTREQLAALTDHLLHGEPYPNLSMPNTGRA